MRGFIGNYVRILQSAAEEYERKEKKLTESKMVAESEDREFMFLSARLIAILQYLKRMQVFESGGPLSRQIVDWRRQTLRVIADGRRIITSMKNPLKAFEYEPITVSQIDDVWLGQYKKMSNPDQKNALIAYGDGDVKCSMMNLLLRCERFEVLQAVYLRVMDGTVTPKDENEFKRYTAVDQKVTDWKEIVKYCADLQNSSQYLTTDKPYVLTRYSGDFDFYGYPQIGTVIDLQGFLSTCGTAKEIVTVDGKRDQKVDMEVRVPPGIPFIPLGKAARIADANEIVLPHGLQAKVLFIRESENPLLIVEIIPPKSGTLRIFKKN
jgi:hypothetical protein